MRISDWSSDVCSSDLGPVTEGPLAAGSFYRPSLIEVEDLAAPLVQQEVFGPVLSFEIFEDEADAIKRANATEFGLATGSFTNDSSAERRVGTECVSTCRSRSAPVA